MAFFQFKNIKISGVASTVPTKVVRGEDFYDQFGEEAVDMEETEQLYERSVRLQSIKQHQTFAMWQQRISSRPKM